MKTTKFFIVCLFFFGYVIHAKAFVRVQNKRKCVVVDPTTCNNNNSNNKCFFSIFVCSLIWYLSDLLTISIYWLFFQCLFDPNKGKSEERDLAVFNPLSQDETVSISNNENNISTILHINILHLHERGSSYILLVNRWHHF